MSAKIFADASQSAVIRFKDGSPSIPALTLQESIIEFKKLAPEKRAVAVIHAASGERFTASEVEWLSFDRGHRGDAAASRFGAAMARGPCQRLHRMRRLPLVAEASMTTVEALPHPAGDNSGTQFS